MTQETRNTTTKQGNKPFYLTTPLFNQADQTEFQGESKKREIGLNPIQVGQGSERNHLKVESDQESVSRKVFTDRRIENQPKSALYKAVHPRNNPLPEATLLPERFVNLLMTSGRKDKARKCLTLALLSITANSGLGPQSFLERIGISDPLKSVTDLSSKQNQTHLKPCGTLNSPSNPTNYILKSKNKASDKQGSPRTFPPKNQGKTLFSVKSKTDKPLHVSQPLSPTGLNSHHLNSLMSACLLNLKAALPKQRKLNPLAKLRANPTQESQAKLVSLEDGNRKLRKLSKQRVAVKPVSSEVIQSLVSMYKANPGSRIKAIERIERKLNKGWTACAKESQSHSPTNFRIACQATLGLPRNLTKETKDCAKQKCGWGPELKFASQVDTRQQVKKELQMCQAKVLNKEDLRNLQKREKLGLQQHPFLEWKDLLSVANNSGLAHAPFQTLFKLYLGFNSEQGFAFGNPLTNQTFQKFFSTLSLPFHGKQFSTSFPVLLSQNSSSLSFVRETLRERFVLTRSGIERRQNTRFGRNYLMEMSCESFLSGLGFHRDALHIPNRSQPNANLTTKNKVFLGDVQRDAREKCFLIPNKDFLLPPPRLSALFRWKENRLPVGQPLINTGFLFSETNFKVGFQTHFPGRNHFVKGGYAERKGVEKPINWFSHFLAKNTSLEEGVKAVRKLFPFVQSTKAKRCGQQNGFNPERIHLLAKLRTVGKETVTLSTVPREPNRNSNLRAKDVRGKTGWEPNLDTGNHFQGNPSKGQGLKSLYIWHTQVLLKGVERVQPPLEVRKVRKGRNTFQVPAVVKQKRGEKLAIKWIVDSARRLNQKGNKGFSESLGNQLLKSFDRLGEARSKRNELLKLAESNRFFLRFRWW